MLTLLCDRLCSLVGLGSFFPLVRLYVGLVCASCVRPCVRARIAAAPAAAVVVRAVGGGRWLHGHRRSSTTTYYTPCLAQNPAQVEEKREREGETFFHLGNVVTHT